MPADRRAKALLPALLVLVALLPDLRAAFPLDTYYFRDFSLTFYPTRLFQARELASGRLPFWNPYLHEGTFHIPSLYPLDLLQAWAQGPAAVSWLLTLHLPLAALAAWALARTRGASPPAAFVTGCVYAAGGFALSSLNLYVFLQALALAPLVMLALGRAAARGGRWTGLAAACVALALSTLALELVAQAVALGLLLALADTWAVARAGPPGATPGASPALAAARLAGAIALGAGLAAVPVAVTLAVLPETARGAGFEPWRAAAFSLPPAGLLQALVAGLFGPPGQPLQAWWGGVVFGKFPYFASIYLGGNVLALLPLGLAQAPRRERLVLGGPPCLAVWYALGPAGGLWSVLQQVPGAGAFRFPSKALFTAHLVAALLAGRGVERLLAGRGWRAFGRAAGLAALVAAALAAVPALAGEALGEWLALDATVLAQCARLLPADAARSAVACGLGLALAVAVVRRLARPVVAVAALAALVALDLVRAGAGLNPQAPAEFFDLRGPLRAERLDQLGGGRVFVHAPLASRGFRAWLAARPPGVDLNGFYLSRQILDPYNNVIDQVETAVSPDRTGLVPQPPEVDLAEVPAERLVAVLPLLRRAAVTRVLSYDPLVHRDLALRARAPVARTGLAVHVFELAGAWPRTHVACRVHVAATRAAAAAAYAEGFDPWHDVALEEGQAPPAGAASPRPTGCSTGRVETLAAAAGEERYVVESDGPGFLVVRSSHARGWRATVDGRATDVLRADGRHRAVAVAAGRHELVLRYHPPGLALGLALSAASAVALALLVARRAGSPAYW